MCAYMFLEFVDSIRSHPLPSLNKSINPHLGLDDMYKNYQY